MSDARHPIRASSSSSSSSASSSSSSSSEPRVGKGKKRLAVGLAVLSAIYVFVPEPTDVIPILGWLDEATALALLGWSLKTLRLTPGAMLARLRATSDRARALDGNDNVIDAVVD